MKTLALRSSSFALPAIGLMLAWSVGCDFVLPLHRESPELDDGVADASGVSDGGTGVTDGSAENDGAIALRQAIKPGRVVDAGSESAPAQITAGDLLVVAVYWIGRGTMQVSDSLNNRWEPLSTLPACGQATTQFFYAEGVTGGSDTVTVKLSEAGTFGFFLLEYQGLLSFDAASELNAAKADASATMQPGPLTTSGARDLVVALFAANSARASAGLMKSGPGFDAVADDQAFLSLAVDNARGLVPPGTYNPTATFPGTVDYFCWSAAAAAFKAP